MPALSGKAQKFARMLQHLHPQTVDRTGQYAPGFKPFAYEGTPYDEAEIKLSGRCIADKTYSWGFSSLLLLTFCSCTLVFVVILILLETDVYWNSRHDRLNQQFSIYLDIIFLAEELKTICGPGAGDLLAQVIDKKTNCCKRGVCLENYALPSSRSRQWRAEWYIKLRKKLKSKDTEETHAPELPPIGQGA